MKRDDEKSKDQRRVPLGKVESAKREPEPDGRIGDGADRDQQVDQRPDAIPDDGMLSGEVGK